MAKALRHSRHDLRAVHAANGDDEGKAKLRAVAGIQCREGSELRVAGRGIEAGGTGLLDPLRLACSSARGLREASQQLGMRADERKLLIVRSAQHRPPLTIRGMQLIERCERAER